jgi:hypothetical protein
MNKVLSFVKKMPKPLQILFMFPITIIGFIFAILITPFFVVYHRSNTTDKTILDETERIFKEGVEKDFKRAIAGIELYKTKFGDYPESTTSKEFIDLFGDWQEVSLLISYGKCENGYELNINNQERLQISFSPDYWQGIGIAKTNVLGFNK